MMRIDSVWRDGDGSDKVGACEVRAADAVAPAGRTNRVDGPGRKRRAESRTRTDASCPSGRVRVRSLTARRLAAWVLAAFVAFLAVPAYGQTEISSDWPLIPSGLNVGAEFRLMFMGKNKRAADSTDIAVYDAYVQGRIAAIGHAAIKAYASHFKVLGSTATVNARTHTGTTGTGGVPIYWLNGQKVADNYGDFYDGSWTSALSARLEDGTAIAQDRRNQVICTGTADDGTTDQPLGAASCTATTIGDTDHTLSGTTHLSTAESRYLVLSGVFRVGNFTTPPIPVVESVAVTSDPGSDGEYVKDDAIKVTVTFSEAVAVTGTPKIKMRLVDGATPVKPRYVAADSTATALVFSYTVKATDYSHDGVIFPRNGIVLGNGGAIKNQAGAAVDADLDYAAIGARSGHKIHVRPEVDSVTVASTPASGTSYATGETIRIDLTFDKAVRVFTDFGTPEVWFVMDASNRARREAAYATTVGDHVVRFDYVVQAGDQDQDGISFMNNAIVWNDGAIIRKEHGSVDDLDELKTLRVYEYGGSTSTYAQTGHRVNAAVSTDATLYDLILDDGNGADTPMNPVFALTTTSYTASVANAVDEITIVPTVYEIHATVAYLDASDATLTDADANKNGFQAPLSVGANTIKVKVTAEDDFTTLTYTITVTRGAASTDATLSSLALTDAANGNTIVLTPGGNRTYTTSVINSVDEITVLPTVNESNATVAYLNASDTALTDADVAKDDFQVALAAGANTVKVKVTAEDEVTTETYTVVVTRAALVPGQVPGVMITPGTGQLAVAWEAVTNADGYKVQWKAGAETFADAATAGREAIVSSGSTTSHTITGLTNGTAYDVQVIATRTNAADETPSAPASGTPVAAPGRVTGVKVTPGTGRLKVVWNAVTNADGYKVQWKSGAETFADAAANSREATVTSGSTRSHTITGLANGTAYDVQVIATRTNADDGTPSAPATDTPSPRARITGVAFTNVPSNNVYNLGDTIEVSITFNTAVEVTGTPKVQMYFVDKHKFYEYANYAAASSTNRVLVFKRLVTGDDDNESTVRVIPDGLKLNGGTIRIKGTTVNADIAHAGTQTDPDIDTQWLEGIAVTSAPAVPETVTGNPVYGPGEKIQFKVTFKNAVDVDQTDGALKLKFRSGSATATYAADYESGTGTKYLVFAWTVPANIPDDGAGLVVPANVQEHGHGFHTSQGLVLNGGTIKSTGGIAVNIRHGQYDTDSRVDTTAPVLAAGADGATVDGTALVLTFQNLDDDNSSDHLDEASVPAPADFAVTVAGAARTVSSVNVGGAAVTLTLASSVNHAETVTVGYTPGTNRIRDRWGNEAAQISSRTVRNDNPEPLLSIQTATAGEGDGTAGFTVELGAVSGAQVTVDYATTAGTATAGSDYTAASGTLTFAPGETSKSISVTIADDDVDEGNETFTVTLSNAVNASIGQATATGTITDDDETVATSTQTTPLASALVSTIGQARAGAATVGNIDTATFAQAQQFTTGDDENGYTISEIVAKLEAVGSNASPRVSIFNDSSGRPGSSLYVLTNPASLANGSNTFTTPANATLAQATNYWVVFENTATGVTAGDRYDIGRTTTYNGNEDAGTASGWSIANLHYLRDSDEWQLGWSRDGIAHGHRGHGQRLCRRGDGPGDGERTDLDDDVDGRGARRVPGILLGRQSRCRIGVQPFVRLRIGLRGSDSRCILRRCGLQGTEPRGEFIRISAGMGRHDPAAERRHACGEPIHLESRMARRPRSFAERVLLCEHIARERHGYRVPANLRADVSGDDDYWWVCSRAGCSQQQITVPLTAALSNVPAEHDGANRFTFTLTFSEDVTGLSYQTLRDHAFTVTGGTMTKAKRVTRGSDQTWTMEVEPSGNSAVTVTLPATTDCAASGAICTNDDHQLSNAVAATIHGPVGISVADTTVTEGANAQLDFVVSLSRAAASPVTVDYLTRDGTAIAGQDFTDTSGTVTFAAGETSKTIAVPVLDDVHDEGSETMKLKLSTASGAQITDRKAIGTITNSDPLQRAWLSRFGRSVGTHVTDAVGDRLRDTQGQSYMTIAGQNIPLGKDSQASSKDMQASSKDTLVQSFTNLDAGVVGDPYAGGTQKMNLREILQGSSFRLNMGADGGSGSHLTAWGRFAGTAFSGRDGDLSLDGDVFTGTVGIDGTWGRVLAGLAVAHSRGDGTYSGVGERGQGALENTLTSLHPYLQYAITDRLNVWGMVGYGWGALDLTLETGKTMETDTRLLMGAVGGRGVLLSAHETGGFELATRSDVMFTNTESDAVAGVDGKLVASEGEAHRLRVVLEGSRAMAFAEGRSLTPTLEVGLRHDWGDAETGFGLEVGGRVQYADPRLGLTVEGTVRGLLAHEDSDYQEWGASANVRLAPGMNGPWAWPSRLIPRGARPPVAWMASGPDRPRRAWPPQTEGRKPDV